MELISTAIKVLLGGQHRRLHDYALKLLVWIVLVPHKLSTLSIMTGICLARKCIVVKWSLVHYRTVCGYATYCLMN